MATALLFSGQGSQYVGMLKDIAEKFPLANQKLNEAKEILGYNVSEILFEGPQEKLKQTNYTQPALFLHSTIVFDLISQKLKFNAVAGHSVGEYAALYAAGVISFEDGLRLVALRGNEMFNAGEDIPGTMFAVIGMDDDKVSELCNELTEEGNLNKTIVAANFNSTGQVVISGSRDYLREMAPSFKQNGAKMVTELQVSGAFHSPLLFKAKEALAKAIESTQFNESKIQVYSNVTANPTTNSKEIKELLISQLTSPVKWTQTLNNMHKDSISSYLEVGPSKVLAGLVKRTLSGVEISNCDNSEDIEKVLS